VNGAAKGVRSSTVSPRRFALRLLGAFSVTQRACVACKDLSRVNQASFAGLVFVGAIVSTIWEKVTFGSLARNARPAFPSPK
jgi:hypothetical protein